MTDPNFLHQGQHAYLGYGLLSKRLHDPIDAIVLSHMHSDHWGRVAHKDLDHRLPVITTPDAAKRLRRRGWLAVAG